MKNVLLITLILFNIRSIAQPTCQWAYLPIGASQTYNTIFNVAVDHSGNIIEVGKILGSADMNPAQGPTDTSFSFGSYNYYISKTDINGSLTWIHYFQVNSQIAFFEFKGLKINSTDDIIVLGNFYGMVDFDLSNTGVDTLRSHFPTYPDYFIAKYDSAGGHQWAFNIGDPTTSSIESHAVTIMPNDNIVISANPTGVLDVDPDIAIHNSIGGNANIICYDSNGNYLWNNNIATTYSYGITNNSIDCDATGNSYLLTVGYYELTVNKFDNTGLRVWDFTLGDFSSGSRVNPQSVLVDKVTGVFYVAGTFGGTVDFDPGTSIASKISTSGFYEDGFIAKYDPNMNLLWVNVYPGEINFGDYSLDFDNSDIVAVGSLTGSVDFGNSVILSSSLSFSPFHIRINTNGVTQNGFILSGQGNYNTINSILNQSFVTTGNIVNNTDMDPSNDSLFLNTNTSNFFTAIYKNSSTTSINQNGSSEMLVAFPNPVNNKLTIKADKSIFGSIYTICDLTGKMILTGNVSDEITSIELNELASGIYIFTVGDSLEYKLKLVKQ